jgi:malate synthase
MAKLKATLGDAYTSGRFDEAVALFKQLVLTDRLEAFLTLPAYKLIS